MQGIYAAPEAWHLAFYVAAVRKPAGGVARDGTQGGHALWQSRTHSGCEPLEAPAGVAHAVPHALGHLLVATLLHRPSRSNLSSSLSWFRVSDLPPADVTIKSVWISRGDSGAICCQS